MTVGCVNPARPGSTDWVPLDSYWYHALDAAGAGRPDPVVERRAAADALSSAPKAWSRPDASTTGRAAIFRSAPTPTPRTSAPTAIGGEVAAARLVPARLGHAPCRHRRSAGRPRPRGRRDQPSIQNSSSTGTLERLGKLDREHRRRHEDAILDRVDGLARDADPLGQLGLGEAELRRGVPSIGWRAVQASRCARRSSMPNVSSAAAIADGHDDMDRVAAVERSRTCRRHRRRWPRACRPEAVDELASALARVVSSLSSVTDFARTAARIRRSQAAVSRTHDSTSHAPILTWSTGARRVVTREIGRLLRQEDRPPARRAFAPASRSAAPLARQSFVSVMLRSPLSNLWVTCNLALHGSQAAVCGANSASR